MSDFCLLEHWEPIIGLLINIIVSQRIGRPEGWEREAGKWQVSGGIRTHTFF